MAYTIVADENIPGLEAGFATLGTITRVNGRKLQRQQLMDADILLVRSVTKVDRQLLDGTPVAFVGSATIGTDHLDTDYLRASGIAWANAPGANASSVVEYVLSAFAQVDGLLERLLDGATVGIVGMGNVGGSLYRRLDALGIRCLAYDPLLDPAAFPVLTDLDTVLKADAVCLHTPLTTGGDYPSFHLVGATQMARLKKGAVLLNAGRGAVIDNAALSHCLDQRHDLTVILDVWENEPAIDPQLMAKVFLASPHIAGYSLDGKLAGTSMIYQACCRALDCGGQLAGAEGESGQILKVDHAGVQALISAILASYDITGDDRRMRAALAMGNQDKRADAFDRLRKEYPLRREFSCYQIDSSEQLQPQLSAYLKALGFELKLSSSS